MAAPQGQVLRFKRHRRGWFYNSPGPCMSGDRRRVFYQFSPTPAAPSHDVTIPLEDRVDIYVQAGTG
jgi:hypothetical protein